MTIIHTPISNSTNAETQDGLSTVKLITPSSLYSAITSNGNVKTALDNNSNATFSSNFTAKTATNAEVQAGIVNNKLVTPSGLLSAVNDVGTVKNAIDNNSNLNFSSNFISKTASNAETQAGVINNKLVTPASLNSAINDAGTIKNSITTIATNTATPIATSISTDIATTITNNAIATSIPIRTYKDLTTSRQQDVNYTNTTNADLIVIVNVVGAVNLIHSIYVNGLIVCSRYAATSAGYVYYGTLEATVPKGNTYSYNSSIANQVQQWIELSAN